MKIGRTDKKQFKRYGRFCRQCEKYFKGNSRTQYYCINCKCEQQQIRYFKLFPIENYLTEDEAIVYLSLKNSNKLDNVFLKLPLPIIVNMNGVNIYTPSIKTETLINNEIMNILTFKNGGKIAK